MISKTFIYCVYIWGSGLTLLSNKHSYNENQSLMFGNNDLFFHSDLKEFRFLPACERNTFTDIFIYIKPGKSVH